MKFRFSLHHPLRKPRGAEAEKRHRHTLTGPESHEKQLRAIDLYLPFVNLVFLLNTLSLITYYFKSHVNAAPGMPSKT